MWTRAGATTSTPQRPNTTEGTEASRSMMVVAGARSRRGASSVRNKAMPIEVGTAISSAISEDTAVPYMKASAPNTALPVPGFGSQVRLVMKPRPSSRRTGQDSLVVVIRIRARIASTSRPVASVHQRKRRSARTPPLLRVRAERVLSWVVWVVTSALDFVELGEGLLLQAARQRRELDVLGDALAVGQHVADERLDQVGLG